MNGGPTTLKARIGLVGKRPEHHVTFNAEKVSITGDLAPLLARASPLFAAGETGKTGGQLWADGELTAFGMTGRQNRVTPHALPKPRTMIRYLPRLSVETMIALSCGNPRS